MKYAAAVVALALAAMPVCGGGQQERFDREYADLRMVEVNSDSFNVEVRGTPGNTVRVTVDGIPDGVTVADRVRRQAVTIHVQGRPSWFDRNSATPVIRIEVPTGIDLDIESASGAIVTRGVQGHLAFRSASGGVTLSDVGGDLQVRTASGAVRVEQAVGSMMLQSASGGVDMARCQGIVAVQTASGHIRARELRLTADARFESSSGGIDVDLVNDLSDLTYRLTSSSGRI